MLISKQQHAKSTAKEGKTTRLQGLQEKPRGTREEGKTTKLQGLQEKPRGTEKLKRILVSQVNG